MSRLAAIAGAMVLGLGLGLAGLATAQTEPAAPPASALLTIDPDALFTQSRMGQRILAQVQADTEALAAENRRIEAALMQEESDLATRRPTMPVDDFRTEAAAFDEKVQGIRNAQDTKQRDLQRSVSAGRDQFFAAAQPILGALMVSRGASVILDRRSVFLGVTAVDITQAALVAIDAEIGDGSGLSPAPEPAPAPALPETPGSAPAQP